METTDAAVASPLGWRSRLASFVIALLLYEASQAVTLLHVAPLFFSAATLRESPWIGYYEHHLWQLAFALACIGIFSRGRFSGWGINLRNAALSWRILWWFCAVFTLITIVFSIVPWLLARQPDPGLINPPTAVNIAGWLSFEWLFVGISEEILFRGLLQNLLAQSWTGVWQVRGVAIPHAGLATTVIFCLAHINPLHPHISWEQQVWAFGLGIYYSTVYYRTGSLLNPILAHNFGDGLVVTAQYLVYLHLR
jgi:membrane protease YdiL (CAAX protease family)